ncbi:MAG: hypothetical protein QOJ70_1789 [Acidobacteriota bacterium]|jgi:hypothetical protein|nr:hypothetical protein [Acidobacteriota bacterium]
MTRKLGLRALLLLLVLGLTASVHAQVSTSGSISGTVRDPQGNAVPKAEITITEETTGVSRTAVGNDDGTYTVSSLPVGRYTVSTAPQGFKKTVNSGVQLHVGDKIVVDLQLEVGNVSEVVTVTSEAQQVETRSADVSSLVSSTQVRELPLNGRNYAQLALMVPGVSPVTQSGAGGAFKTGGTGLDSGVDMSVNGNGSNQNMWTVDGVNNMDVGSNRTLLVFPSIDSIAEFRVERNSFSAEYGQAQGAVINLVTKGGGNSFHGGLFEFFRNDALNSNDFFLNRAGQKKGPLRYNNYGGNLSGPIQLPRFGEGGPSIWNGKNKAFFFWSEEWRRERRGQVLTGRVPTAAEKIGDFSGTLTGPLPHIPGGVCNPPTVTSGCFPGNRIPQSQLSPAGLALMQLYPNPNTANPTAGQNWASAPMQPVDTRQDLIRGDVNVTDKMNVMVRYINETWTHGVAAGNFWGDSPFPTLSSDWDQPSHSFALKLSNTLSSTAVNEFQFSRAGNDIFVKTSAQSQALADQVGSLFPTVFPANHGAVPSVFWGPGGYDTLWHQAPWQNHEDLLIWKDDFSKVLGSHDTKFGVLVSHNIKNEEGNGAAGGNQPAAISGCGVHTGNCIADFLLRDATLVNYMEQDAQPVANGRWRDYEFYGNDTWKMRSNITLTLGMRYSQFPQAYENNNRISNFIPSLYNGTDYRTGLVLASQAAQFGLPRSLVNTYKKGFQPRVGIAWDVHGDGKMAVRAGFGRYLSRSNVIEDVNRMSANPPFTTTVSSPGWQGETDRLADCPTCRSLDTINPGLRNSVAGVDPNAGFAAVDPNFRPPDSYQWNLTVSREIMKDTVLEASYIGNEGHHIWRRNVNKNDIAPGAARLAIANAVFAGVDTTTLVNNARPLRGVGNITVSESTGNSNYNALQLWLNRRFARNLAYQASYTWGHTLSDVALTAFTNTTSDPYNYHLDYGDADLDRRHTFVSNLVYVMPSFKHWGPVARGVIGDWQVNGIFSYFGTTPVDITTGVNTIGTASSVGQRPNLVPGQPIYLNTGDSTLWLNPKAFALPAPGQMGNLSRGMVRGKPINTLDASLNKNWGLSERTSLQFRAEFFNLLNHPNFVGFNTGINFQGNHTQPNFGQPTNGAFGTLNATQNHREIQFGLKLNF